MDDDDCHPFVSHHQMVEPFVKSCLGWIIWKVFFFTPVWRLTRNVSHVVWKSFLCKEKFMVAWYREGILFHKILSPSHRSHDATPTFDLG